MLRSRAPMRFRRCLPPRVCLDTLISTPPSPRSAPRGYSRPVAAVTSRHQRVAVWPLIPLSGSKRAAAPGHGHNRCRRQVATLDIVRTPVSDFSAMRTRTMSKVARPPIAPPPDPGGWGNLQSAICNLQFAIRNGRAGGGYPCIRSATSLALARIRSMSIVISL